MNFCKKAIIWDLDNTLYRKTDEFGNLLDEVMARVAIDMGLDMGFEDALKTVKDSYAQYRDGGEIFYRNHGIDEKEFYDKYHDKKIEIAVPKITPYENLLEKLKQIPLEQYIFTHSNVEATKAILKQIGLYEFFRDRFFSVEDFEILTKNQTAEVYIMLCNKIGVKPEDCIFVDDSYSNLKYPKEIGMTTVRIYYNQNSSKDKDYIDAAYKGTDSFLDDVIPRIQACS